MDDYILRMHTVPLIPVQTIVASDPDASMPPWIDDPDELDAVRTDAASMQGRGARALIQPRSEASLAMWLAANPDVPILAQGALTSLTGGATPDDDVVVSTKRMTALRIDERAHRVVVQPGVLIATLQEALAEKGLYYPPAPTHDGASIGGNIATNAAGGATFKYGTTRDWVERIRVMTRHGDVWELRRGDHVVPAGSEVEIVGSRRAIIPIPSYSSPKVKKSSAGYRCTDPIDLIDLFIGSEGTLGIITEAELRVVPRPRVLTGLVSFASLAGAVAFAGEMRERSLRTRSGGIGMDVRSIEMFDERCLRLLESNGKLAAYCLNLVDSAAACLLFEQELGAEASYDQIVDELALAMEKGTTEPSALADLVALLRKHDAVDACELALPNDSKRQAQLASLRESIPTSINELLAHRKKQHPEVHKVGGDMIVPFERFAEMLQTYYEVFGRAGIEVAVFGHISDGNVHPNGLPEHGAQMQAAKDALIELAGRCKQMGGCPLSEHGVGKSPMKKRILAEFWGEGPMAQMRSVKAALDPGWTLCRGVLFDKA